MISTTPAFPKATPSAPTFFIASLATWFKNRNTVTVAHDLTRRLVVVQRFRRFDCRRPPCGRPRAHETHHRKHRNGGEVSRGIARLDAPQHRIGRSHRKECKR